jgi:hypothetical protein
VGSQALPITNEARHSSVSRGGCRGPVCRMDGLCGGGGKELYPAAPQQRPRDVPAPRSRPSSACDGTVSRLTVSLLIELSDKLNEPGGDGLRKVVLCSEISPDRRWNLAQLAVVLHRSSMRRRAAYLEGKRDYPSADHSVEFVDRTEPAFGQGEQLRLVCGRVRSRGRLDRSVFSVVRFGHGVRSPWLRPYLPQK